MLLCSETGKLKLEATGRLLLNAWEVFSWFGPPRAVLWEVNVEIDCYDVKSYLPDDNGTGVSFDVLCNSAAKARAGALAWLYANRCCCNNCPLVESCRRGACAEKKNPRKPGRRPPVG